MSPVPSKRAQSGKSRTSTANLQRLRQRAAQIKTGGKTSEKSSVKKQSVLITQLSTESDFDTDLEEEAVELPSTARMTPRDLYIKTCEHFNVVPVEYFMRHMTDPYLSIKYHGLGSEGAKALAVPLQVNTYITDLDLEGNWLESGGVKHIAYMLHENLYITKLNLAYNNLRNKGAKTICRTLQVNNVIQHIDLSGNGFEDKDAKHFYKVLERNTALLSFNLSNNEFCEDGATVLGKALEAVNDTIQTFDLSWNHVRTRGAEGLARGLKENSRLKSLNLSMNGFHESGTRIIASLLEDSDTLEELDLSNNRINHEGTKAIAKAMFKNCSLKILRLALNPFPYAATYDILKAIEENENSAIELLDLDGIVVHKEFMNDVATLKQERVHFNIQVGYVSAGKEVSGTVEEECNNQNPLEILLLFMSDKNLRLVDLFKSFDKDQSMSLSREEFMDGLKTLNTPLSESQLDTLITMLDEDGDGEVDLKEILNINRRYKGIKRKVSKRMQEQRQEKAKNKLKLAVKTVGALKEQKTQNEEEVDE